MNVEIASKLVNLRKSKGLSQEALAEKIGVSRHAVSKWERAESSPDTDKLIALSRLYDITLDDMVGSSQDSFERKVEVSDNVEENSNKVPFLEMFPYPILVTIVYLFIGIVWDWWHPGWLLFLTIPLWAAFVKYSTSKHSSPTDD